jgi:hypothetical protein
VNVYNGRPLTAEELLRYDEQERLRQIEERDRVIQRQEHRRERRARLIRGEPQEPSAGDRAEDEEKRGSKPSQATVLVELAVRAGVRLFHDAEQAAYTTVPVNNRLATWPLKSTAFKRWLSRLFYATCEKAPGGQAIADATAVLEGRALFDAAEHAVHVRLAEHQARSIWTLPIRTGAPSKLTGAAGGFWPIPRSDFGVPADSPRSPFPSKEVTLMNCGRS